MSIGIRPVFEQWALEQGFDIGRADDNSYRTESTDAAWGGWVAANAPTPNTSAALERVIAEQQTKIDHLTAEVTRGHETLNTMWNKHNDLFDSFARLIDAHIPDSVDHGDPNNYRRLRQSCRVMMLEAGYCMTCYNFLCECEGQYD